jgi:hypothetical protein
MRARFAPVWSSKLSPGKALSLGSLPYCFLPFAAFSENKLIILISAGLLTEDINSSLKRTH